MDADELLARQLQAEELRSAGPSASAADGTRELSSQLLACLDKVQKCEDPLLQALALSIMPIEDMRAEVHATLALNAELNGSEGSGSQLGEEELLAKQLLQWFKGSFFSWTDKAACSTCGCKDTSYVGTTGPSPEERSYKASRTEMYKCTLCGQTTRFPRYNDVQKLLETRCGRCGEWANAFLLFCRAAGLTARYVWDQTDHVWTEMYSHTLGRWVHMDSCEAAFDKPLLYEAGWGKRLSYVIAVGLDGVVDVTRRYTRKWDQVRSARTLVSEQWLASKLSTMTSELRAGLPADVLAVLEVRDMEEKLELMESLTAAPSSADVNLPGRTTGSLEWRQQRGETGDAPAPAHLPAATNNTTAAPSRPAAAGPAPPPCTEYVPLPQLRPPGGNAAACAAVFRNFGRLVGPGGCRASGHNDPDEAASKAFDGRVSTKWLDFGGAGAIGTAWLELRLLSSQPPVTAVAYDLVSANDCPERDPMDWVVEGVVVGQQADAEASDVEQWTVLDEQRGARFTGRQQLRTFAISTQAPCRRLRLRITSALQPSAANSMQLACWNVYGPGAISAIAAADAQAASCAQAVAAAATRGEVPDASLALIKRVVANVHTQPQEAKFRKVRASKVQPLWDSPCLLALMAAVGFRPLLLPETTASGSPEDLFLVLEEGGEATAGRIAAAHEVLAA